MNEAIPYSPEYFHGVENRLFQDRDSGCPTSGTLHPGGVLNAELYLGGHAMLRPCRSSQGHSTAVS